MNAPLLSVRDLRTWFRTDDGLVKAVDAPINIVARAGTPPVAELERIGVARVSIASGASLAVMSLIQRIAEQLHGSGRFDVLEHAMNRADAQKLFAPRN